MSVGPDPQVNVELIEQTRKQINRLFEEVARMSELEIPQPEYYREFLTRVLQALAAPAGAVWGRTPQGNLQLQYQINMQQVGLSRDEETRQSHDELLRQVVLGGKPMHVQPHSSAGKPEGQSTVAPGNPTDFVVLIVPITVDKQVAGLVEVWQMPDRHPSAIPGFLTFMTHMAELAARYTRNMTMSQLTRQQQLWVQLEAYARQVHASLNPVEVAYVVANEGRRLIDCDRVSVGVRYGKRVVVEAVSGSDVVERRSNLVQLMRKLFEAVLLWGEKLVYTGTKDDSLPPNVLTALDGYLAESNSKLLEVIPLRDEREGENPLNPPRSVMMMECFEPQVAPEQLTARLEVVARHVTPALYNAVEHRRIPFRFLWMPIAKLQEGLGGKSRAILTAILVGLGIAFLAMYFVPYPLKMDATGQLLSVVRAQIFAPDEGRMERWQVWPGDKIGEEAVLGDLYDMKLAERVTKLNGEILGARDQYASYRRLAGDPRLSGQEMLNYEREAMAARSTERERQGELDLLVQHYQAFPDQPGHFKVLSPKFPPLKELPQNRQWTVLTRDFRENTTNRAVKPSEMLLRLGFLEGEWEVELKIPQKHIGQVLRGFEYENTDVLDVDLIVKSAVTQTFKGKLYRNKVGAEAIPNPNQTDSSDQELVVICSVVVNGDDIPQDKQIPARLLVTGTEVHAKVRCGNHKMGYSLFYPVWEFIYEKAFSWF